MENERVLILRPEQLSILNDKEISQWLSAGEQRVRVWERGKKGQGLIRAEVITINCHAIPGTTRPSSRLGFSPPEGREDRAAAERAERMFSSSAAPIAAST